MNTLPTITDRWFYLLSLPLGWAVCSLLHFRHPGDEYAMYFISSIAGSWIFLLFQAGDIHSLAIPLSIAAVGMLVMVTVGLLLVWLRVRKAVWLGLFAVCAFAILGLTVSAYPSFERALAKNGSWWAYLCSSAELGMYCASVLSIAATAIGRLVRRVRRGRGSGRAPPEVLD